MSQEKKFYVYVHRYATGPKAGQVFYVGKGSGGLRYKSDRGRNKWWGRISKKYGFTPEIIFRFNCESCAFSFERALISFYGRGNLCNLSDGGEGPCGFKHSIRWKEKMSKFMTGRKVSNKTKEKLSNLRKRNPTKNLNVNHVGFYVTNSDGETFPSINEASRVMSRKTGLTNSHGNITRCLKGISKTAYGVSWAYGKNTPKLKKTNRGRKVVNVDTGEVFDGVKDAACSMLSRNGKPKGVQPISKALRGERETAYGFTWRYLDEL
jgi:hypothetical protein